LAIIITFIFIYFWYRTHDFIIIIIFFS
jgi:hypothetical protein